MPCHTLYIIIILTTQIQGGTQYIYQSSSFLSLVGLTEERLDWAGFGILWRSKLPAGPVQQSLARNIWQSLFSVDSVLSLDPFLVAKGVCSTVSSHTYNDQRTIIDMDRLKGRNSRPKMASEHWMCSGRPTRGEHLWVIMSPGIMQALKLYS